MKYIHLTPRMELICSLVDKSKVLADIGCDHGRFSVACLQRGLCEKVIASDISPFSVEKTKKLLTLCELTDKAVVVESNGLSHLQSGQADTIVIAGMGGILISELLDKNREIAKNATLILQPMRGIVELRKYLFSNGYCIKADVIAKEDRRYYQIIKTAYNGKKDEIPEFFPENFFEVGYKSVIDNSENLYPMLKKLEKIYESNSEKSGEFILELTSIQKIIERIQNGGKN